MSFTKNFSSVFFREKNSSINLRIFKRSFKMTWRSIGKNNTELINQMKEYGVISSDAVADAMKATDRKYYCPLNAYVDAPQNIGYGVTISAPHMHAYALEYLRNHLKPGCHVLDIGSGSGYLTACFYRFIQAQGENAETKVIGVEHQPGLVQQSKDNLNKDDPEMLKTGKVIIIEGDGRKGCSKFAPYSAIHVGAAASEKPVALIKQLAKGGRLIVPVGPEFGQQYLMQYDKREDGKVNETRLVGVLYVPLTDLNRK